MRIADRTFIVSGGSSGLGLATVADLLTSDAYVSIVDLKPPNDLELQSSSHIKFFQTDVSNVNEIEKAVDGTVAWTKGTGAALGGVINCAGVGTVGKVSGLRLMFYVEPHVKRQIIDSNNNPLSLDLWDFTLAVNLTGTFNLTRLALKHLVTVPPEGPDGERGIIILVASSVAVSPPNMRSCLLFHIKSPTVRRPARPSSIRSLKGCTRINDSSNVSRPCASCYSHCDDCPRSFFHRDDGAATRKSYAQLRRKWRTRVPAAVW